MSFSPTALFKHGSPVMFDYTPPSVAVNAGDVIVLNDCPRIAHRDIAVGVLGALAGGFGVYTMPKATSGGSGIAAGTQVFWNATAKQITTTSTGNTFFGWTVNTSLDADTTQSVLHLPGSGAVAAALTNASLTDSTGGTVSATLAAITAGASYAQADMVAAKNAIASLAAQLNALTTSLRAAGLIQ